MTQHGVATVGLGNGTTSWTGAASVTLNPQSASGSVNSQEGQIRDGNGRVIAMNYTDHENELSVDVIPSHATDASTAAPPAPGTVVTLASFELDWINGDWNVKSGVGVTVSNTPDGRVRLTIPLTQPYNDDALAAVV